MGVWRNVKAAPWSGGHEWRGDTGAEFDVYECLLIDVSKWIASGTGSAGVEAGHCVIVWIFVEEAYVIHVTSY